MDGHGRCVVVIRDGESILHTDTVNPLDATARSRVVATVAKPIGRTDLEKLEAVISERGLARHAERDRELRALRSRASRGGRLLILRDDLAQLLVSMS